MKKIILLILTMLMFSTIFSEEIYLKSGEKITGEIIEDTKEFVKLKTKYGELKIEKNSMIIPETEFQLKNGDVITGIILQKKENEYLIRTKMGELKVNKNDIKDLEYIFVNKSRIVSKKKFYSSEEKVIDVFFNPTANTLDKGTLYISGFSYGFGITDNFQVMSNWSQYFMENLNFKAKLRVLNFNTKKSKHMLSLGGSFNSKYPKYHSKQSDWDLYSNRVNNYVEEDPIELFNNGGMLLDATLVYSLEKEKSNGKYSYNLGTTYNTSNIIKPFLSIWYDISPKVIYMVEFKGNYDVESGNFLEKEPFDYFDTGFLFAITKKFRVGIHYKAPFFMLYYKF